MVPTNPDAAPACAWCGRAARLWLRDQDGDPQCRDCRREAVKAGEERGASLYLLTVGGTTRPVGAWAKDAGLKANTLFERLYRGVEDARLLAPTGA